MKKSLNARKARILKLNRETLLHLEKNDLRAVGGANQDPNFSVKFCTELGCPTEGCPAEATASC